MIYYKWGDFKLVSPRILLAFFILKLFILNLMAQNLITKQVFYHCKKGWENCEECGTMHKYRYALLLLNPSDNPQAVRPVIKTADGWVTYEIIQWFGTLQEAQQYSTANSTPIEIAEEDKYPLLQKLAEKLPEKWFLILYPENSELVIYSPQTIYRLFENKINAPVSMLKTDRSEFVKNNGEKTYPHITYVLKKPLSENEKKEIEEKNTLLMQEIEGLPKKYNIQHLKPEYNRGKDVFPNYPDATKKEKKRIEEYQKELKELQKMHLPTPLYSTPEFDLWNESITGIESAMESVYPESASQETYKVLQLVRLFFSQK